MTSLTNNLLQQQVPCAAGQCLTVFSAHANCVAEKQLETAGDESENYEYFHPKDLTAEHTYQTAKTEQKRYTQCDIDESKWLKDLISEGINNQSNTKPETNYSEEPMLSSGQVNHKIEPSIDSIINLEGDLEDHHKSNSDYLSE